MQLLGRTVRKVAKSTLDPSDHVRFQSAGNWWRPDSGNTMLYAYNQYRVQYILSGLKRQDLAGLRVLDVGCGAGLLCQSMFRLGASRVVGLDSSSNLLSMAREHAPNTSIQYRQTLLEQYQQQQQFDIVTAMEVIEHVQNPAFFIGKLAERVAPGGSLFLSTISRSLRSYVQTILLAECFLGVVDKGTHQWSKYLNSEEVQRLLQAEGIKVSSLQRLTADPLSLRIKPDTGGSLFILHGVK